MLPAKADGKFPTTNWTLISRLSSGDEAVKRVALEDLCRQYHYPLYCYIRRRGLEHHDAQDALHDFLAKLLRRDAFQHADSEKGRLRALLSTALQRFLYNWFRDNAHRRQEHSLDAHAEMAEAHGRFQREILPTEETPEHIFERKWAHELLQRVRLRLCQLYQERDKRELFEVLQPALLAGGSLRGLDVAAMAAPLNMTEAALRVAMSRLRVEYGELLREEVMQTVDSADEVEAELNHLIRIFKS